MNEIELARFYSDLAATMPEVWLGCGAMVLLLIGVFAGDKQTTLLSWACVGLLAFVGFLVATTSQGSLLAFDGTVVIDDFGRFAKILVLTGSALAVLMSIDYLKDEKLTRFEYPLLITLASLGMMTMVSANDLIVLYVGLELQSLALYVLAAFARDNARSSEAGLKYFVLGALSSGMLLYGATLIYGYTGTTNFEGIAQTITQNGIPVGLKIGIVFVMAGLAFKVSAVPFHMWTPDVYEGSPTPVTAFFAAAPKIAAMALFLRVVFGPLGEAGSVWLQIVMFLSVASMLLGAIAAIGQNNIKRLMAYSSIGHMGYALIGIAAGNEAGVQGILIYLVIYLAMTVGTFICIMHMRRGGKAVEDISELAGLSKHDPTTAYILAILMFSLIGIPPLAGFWGKWYVFLAAVEAKLYVLAAIGFVTSVIGAFYYLRIIKVMFFDEAAAKFEKPLSNLNAAMLAASCAFVLLFVVSPLPVTNAAALAAKSLFP